MEGENDMQDKTTTPRTFKTHVNSLGLPLSRALKDMCNLAGELEQENIELRKHLLWLLTFPKCECVSHGCRWQQDKCCCGYDNKLQAALSAVAKGI